MAENTDVSSYKYTPVDPLAKAGQYNQLESQNLAISKQKLDLLNQQYQQFNKDIVGLAEDPNLTPDKVIQRGQQMVKSGFLDQKTYQNFINGMPTDPNQLRNYVRQAASRSLSNAEAVNFHYGQNSFLNTGAANVPLNQRPGMGPTQSGIPIQSQLSPGEREAPVPVYDPNSDRTVVIPKEQAIRQTGGNPLGPAVVAPVTPGVRLPVATQPEASRIGIAGPSGNIEVDRKTLADDRAASTGKMQAIKPMVQAVNAIGNLKTGIGTNTINDIKALATNLGIASQDIQDEAVLYQEINKKLSNYISQSSIANRSDAGQALAAASNPNVQGQLNPALVNLAKDAIAQDRVEAARALKFSADKGNKVEGYSEFRSKFPNSIDEKAFKIDLLPAEERNKLIEKHADFKDGKLIAKKDAASKKFWESMAIAKSTGVLNPVQ